MHELRNIIHRLRQGDTSREIARTQRVSRDTVAKVRNHALEAGWLDKLAPLPCDADLARRFTGQSQRPQNLSTVEAFRDLILTWHGQGIRATTMRAALARNHGFTGSVHAIYRFLERNAPQTGNATVILDFEPAEMAQIDFGMGPPITDRVSGETFKTWFFVATLAWSRHHYAEVVRDQSVATWLACHRHAFEFWGGVPRVCRIDNLKSAITKASYYEPQVQRSYADLALGYQFRIDPCPVADPQKKGRVESGVKFIKGSFAPLREFHSIAHANEQLRAWILGEAGHRVHGTTRQQPLKMFNDFEKTLLQPLPAIAPECPVWVKAKLHGNCHVQVNKCHYSAPYRLIGQELWVELAPRIVRIYRDHELVAIHPRKFKPGERSTTQDHLPPDAQAYFMRDPQWCLLQARSIGPACHAVIESLFANRVLDNLRAAQGVIGLGESFGRVRLEAACARAVSFGVPKYFAVKKILHDGLDRQEQPQPASALEAPYSGGARFGRNAADLLH